MGRQARDRPPNGGIDCLNWDIGRGAAIAPPIQLLGLGLLPRLSPTAPEIAAEPPATHESPHTADTFGPLRPGHLKLT
ncbi:MAG: hypothetical protein LVS60_07495 [Nodosilinea sp. LVE1205-7]|jgi:hypothetical protein